MRLLFGVVAVLALAGCEADGRPSHLWGSAADGFARGYGDGPPAQAPVRQAPQPLQVAPPPSPTTAQAFFTGAGKQVQTVTGAMAWECEYSYAGREFFLMFDSYCPPSASVR